MLGNFFEQIIRNPRVMSCKNVLPFKEHDKDN